MSNFLEKNAMICIDDVDRFFHWKKPKVSPLMRGHSIWWDYFLANYYRFVKAERNMRFI